MVKWEGRKNKHTITITTAHFKNMPPVFGLETKYFSSGIDRSGSEMSPNTSKTRQSKSQ